MSAEVNSVELQSVAVPPIVVAEQPPVVSEKDMTIHQPSRTNISKSIRVRQGYMEPIHESGSEVSANTLFNIIHIPTKSDAYSKTVEEIAEQKFLNLFGSDELNFEKIPDAKSEVRYTPTYLSGITDEDKLSPEDRTKLCNIRSYTEIREMMNTKFSYKEGLLSSTLDVLSQYMRGQKLLYLESKSYCEFYLYRLMIPTIFISTACSVVGGIMSNSAIASMAVAAANGFNTLLLAIINYFKLDARAEAHRMTAYSFDQLISECEFTSGKILLSNLVKDEHLRKDAEEFDLKYVQDFISELEQKVKEIKQKNQFIIPDIIRHRYKNVYYTNVFALVNQAQIQEMIMANQLKLACNAFTEVENRIIKGDRRPEVYIDYNMKLKQKNDLIEKILEHRQNLLTFDQVLRHELKKNNRCCRSLLCCY